MKDKSLSAPVFKCEPLRATALVLRGPQIPIFLVIIGRQKTAKLPIDFRMTGRPGIRLAPGQIPPGWAPTSGKPGRPPMQMPQLNHGQSRMQHVSNVQHRLQTKSPHMPPASVSPNLYHNQRIIPPQYQQPVRPPCVISPGPRSTSMSPNVLISPMSPNVLSPHNPGRPRK